MADLATLEHIPAEHVTVEALQPRHLSTLPEALSNMSPVNLDRTQLHAVYAERHQAGVQTYVAALGDIVLATASVLVVPGIGGKLDAIIEDVATNINATRRGFGRLVVNRCVEAALLMEGTDRIILDQDDERNGRWYRSLGFEYLSDMMRLDTAAAVKDENIRRLKHLFVDASTVEDRDRADGLASVVGAPDISLFLDTRTRHGIGYSVVRQGSMERDSTVVAVLGHRIERKFIRQGGAAMHIGEPVISPDYVPGDGQPSPELLYQILLSRSIVEAIKARQKANCYKIMAHCAPHEQDVLKAVGFEFKETCLSYRQQG